MRLSASVIRGPQKAFQVLLPFYATLLWGPRIVLPLSSPTPRLCSRCFPFCSAHDGLLVA